MSISTLFCGSEMWVFQIRDYSLIQEIEVMFKGKLKDAQGKTMWVMKTFEENWTSFQLLKKIHDYGEERRKRVNRMDEKRIREPIINFQAKGKRGIKRCWKRWQYMKPEQGIA